MRSGRIVGSLFGLALAVQACGGREPIWDQYIRSEMHVQGLERAVAVVDEQAHRVLLLRAQPDQRLDSTPVQVGRNVVATAASPAGDKLYVLSTGDQPRTKPSDQPPQLAIIDPVNPANSRTLTLTDPLTKMAVDPAGKRLVIHAGDPSAGSFIQNPNELVFVDLSDPASPPTARVLPSLLGGYPKRLTFAHVNVGGDALERDLLLIESDRDLMIIDLTDPATAEVTVPLSDQSAQLGPLAPREIAVDAGAGLSRPPTIAVRSDNDNVYLFSLVASNASPPNKFVVAPTTVTVGSAPSDFAFVRTEQGVRLAVLVPGGSAAAPKPAAYLVNPADSQLVRTDLADAYSSMSISRGAESEGSYDHAVLYGATGANAVALWNIGKAVNPGSPILNPPRRVALEASVSSVIDIPNTSRKILRTNGNIVYIFDLDRETASPLTTQSQVTLQLGLEPERAWAYAPGQQQLAKVNVSGPYVEPVLVGQGVADVFEIAADGGPALLVLEGYGNQGSAAQPEIRWRSTKWNAGNMGGVSVFNAAIPDAARAHRYPGLLLEGLLP